LFNAIIPMARPIVAIQVDESQLVEPAASELLARLEIHFMSPVVLVAWDREARFHSHGFPCPENLLIDDDLQWREFTLPDEPEIPF
jgi:hypothetical protein